MEGHGVWAQGEGDYSGGTLVPDDLLGVQVPRDTASSLSSGLILTNRPYPALLTEWRILIPYQP